MPPNQTIIIVGCGRLGSMLANQLSRQGHGIVVIDRVASAFDSLSTEFSGFTVTGDAAELAVLRRAKIGQAGSVLAVTRHDNVNLMVAQVARTVFGVPRVIARIFDPARECVYREFGIETVCPTTLSARVLLDALAPQGPDSEQEPSQAREVVAEPPASEPSSQVTGASPPTAHADGSPVREGSPSPSSTEGQDRD